MVAFAKASPNTHIKRAAPGFDGEPLPSGLFRARKMARVNSLPAVRFGTAKNDHGRRSCAC